MPDGVTVHARVSVCVPVCMWSYCVHVRLGECGHPLGPRVGIRVCGWAASPGAALLCAWRLTVRAQPSPHPCWKTPWYPTVTLGPRPRDVTARTGPFPPQFPNPANEEAGDGQTGAQSVGRTDAAPQDTAAIAGILLLQAAWILPDPISTLDVTFDPRTWTLSWACAGDIAVTACRVTTPGVWRQAEPRGCRCRFLPMELHRGAELEVNGTADGEAVVRRLSFVNAGAANSGAEDLACEIRDARFLCCAWRAGPAAPTDVQYSLRVLNTTGHDVARCSAPPGEDAAVTTHCRADDLSLLPRKVYVIVSGRSQAGPVRFLDAVVNTKMIERLSPPRDVIATCNSSHCAVAWAPPLTWADMSALDFRFEVEWKNTELGSAPQKVLISGPEVPSFAFPCPAPRGRHAVRVRAGDLRSERWSDWSPALELGDVRGDSPNSSQSADFLFPIFAPPINIMF